MSSHQKASDSLTQVRPNATPLGPLNWAKVHLFSSPFNSFITLILMYILISVIPYITQWLLINAHFSGTTREACTPAIGGETGACWVFIRTKFSQIVYGFYPDEFRWRVNAVVLFSFLTAASWFARNKLHKHINNALPIWTFVILPILCWHLLEGTSFGLPAVETAKWGGVFLTLLVSTVGIVCSLPLGIALALGRQSKLPAVRTISTLFIELWRGVPLITVLFMSSVMFPLFFPDGVTFDKLLRALIGVSLFSAAYMAEVVRGGLQAIPKGQFEAAEALGLNYWQSMRLVVMPQALKLVIPGIVNTFIGLFKDTTLVAIIGMFDLLGIVQTAATDPEWLGMILEGYVFAGLFFWACCFSMSKYSQTIEARLNTGH